MLELELQYLDGLFGRCVHAASLSTSRLLDERVHNAIIAVLEEEWYEGDVSTPEIFGQRVAQALLWQEELVESSGQN
jgi:hypothetical protein